MDGQVHRQQMPGLKQLFDEPEERQDVEGLEAALEDQEGWYPDNESASSAFNGYDVTIGEVRALAAERNTLREQVGWLEGLNETRLHMFNEEYRKRVAAEAEVERLRGERDGWKARVDEAEWRTQKALDEAIEDARRIEAAEARVAELEAYITYTPCPNCGLPDPRRPGADCDQCGKARRALDTKGGSRER